MSTNEANWYVLHTYSGYEKAVKASIEKMVENRKMRIRSLPSRSPWRP